MKYPSDEEVALRKQIIELKRENKKLQDALLKINGIAMRAKDEFNRQDR